MTIDAGRFKVAAAVTAVLTLALAASTPETAGAAKKKDTKMTTSTTQPAAPPSAANAIHLIYFHEVDKGGHFAGEQPQLFSEELRAAFRSLRGNAAATAGSH